VTHKTVNKHTTMKVPVFECMLADDSKKHEKKMTGEVFVEPKLDGVRVITICDVERDEVKMYSRNGKELNNFPKIYEQFDAMLDQLDQSMVFDGEVMSDDFQTLMREIHRKGGAKTDDAVLNLFDCLPLDDFKEGGSNNTLAQRKQWLDGYRFGPNISRVEHILIDLDDEDGQKQFADYNRLCIDKGFEGIMIKPITGVYECKRSSLWLKVKPFIEVSLTVKAVEEGTGRNEGRLGALIVEGEDDGKFIRTNVGSGLSDDDRTEYWKAKDKLIGQIVEVRADAITQNQDATDEWSLRFPRFLRFRGFDPRRETVMSEFRQGIYNLLRQVGGTSIGRAVIYTIGHIVIAMTCNRLITGADWALAGADAIIEPMINGVWYYFLDKLWSTKLKQGGN
jgi:DNA ligase 1